jgi:endonuclease/exonuclease/phosphatase family metal-dependent hydrolase
MISTIKFARPRTPNRSTRRESGPSVSRAALLALALALGAPWWAHADSPGSAAAKGPEIVLGTFNIHYVAPGQDRLAWENRREAVIAALEEGGADVLAFQEMETFAGGHWNDENVQLEWVRQHFPEYAAAAVGDPRVYPSTQPILIRRERFEALEQGFFFFSPDPDVPYSRPWRGRYPAFCSWIRVSDRFSENRFYVYNVHFDHSSRENRLRAARLLVERMQGRRHPDEAVVVLGDFNAARSFRPVTLLLRQGLEAAKVPGSTYHFYRGLDVLPAIDHALYSPQFRCVDAKVLRRRYQGVWPGDHYPVFVTLRPASPADP